MQWKTWTIRGRRGACRSSLGSGRRAAFLGVGRPSCKPRHVSSGILRRVRGRVSRRRRWRLPVSSQAYSKAPADKHRSAAHTEQRFSMAHVSFEWQDPLAVNFFLYVKRQLRVMTKMRQLWSTKDGRFRIRRSKAVY